MASKKKLKKQLKKALQSEASKGRMLAEANEVWDQYDEFQRWMRKHAPATVRRHVEMTDINLPRYRPHTMDEIMKYHYAPAIRSMLDQSTPLFNALQSNDA
jgi:hypothetical protein